MKSLFLFLLGGGLYVALEFFWRGRSHVSMFIAGGLSLMLLGGVYRWFFTLPVAYLCAMGALLITSLEFITGAIVNLKLQLGVWDYSRMRFNLYGQICLGYSLLWFLLCAPGVAIVAVVYAL